MSVPQQSSVSIGLDPLIHEDARLRIIATLNECDAAGFTFLLGATKLTRGNLSAHMSKLSGAGYVAEKKKFVNRMPYTEYRLTTKGGAAYKKYLSDWKKITSRK